MGIFYVYEHWRPDKNVCFYVGKGGGGSGKRKDKLVRTNKAHIKVLRHLNRQGMCPEVRMWKSGLSEKEAFDFEIIRIAWLRKKGHPLTNIAKGGQGSSGWHHSETRKQEISKEATGRRHSKETKLLLRKIANNKPREVFTKSRHKISASVSALWKDPAYRSKLLSAHAKRLPISSTTRAKMRAAQKARRKAHPVSKSTRAKVSASIKAWHAKRRRLAA